MENVDPLSNSSGKKGKKKKKRRVANSLSNKVKSSPGVLPDPIKNSASFGRNSSSGANITGSYSQNDFEDDITGSKSLTSLGDLPAPMKKTTLPPSAV